MVQFIQIPSAIGGITLQNLYRDFAPTLESWYELLQCMVLILWIAYFV